MLTSDPKSQFEELKTQLLSQIGQTFPIKDRTGRFEVRVSNLSVEDHLGVDDLKGQAEARLKGRSWTTPVTGTIEVVDAKDGSVLVSRPNALIAKIPKLTRHYSYIVGGQEKTIANQWRLRPGAYVKATERAGEYEAQFQLSKGRSFDVQIDEVGYVHMKVGSRKIPMYSVLSAMGISDDSMKAAWGPTTFKASKDKSNPDKDLKSLYEVWRKESPAASADLKAETHAIFEATRLDPEVAHANLGIRTEAVTAPLLFEASKKLIDVAAKRREPDPIDSLRYKELWGAKDQFVFRMSQSAPEITRRVQQALGKSTVQRRLLSGDKQVIRDVFMPDLIQRPLNHVFTTSLSSNGKQTNPLAMLGDHNLVTITGPGGIENPHALSKSNTALDPSHLGFLDPVYTPESNAGVNTHLAFGVTVKDRKPRVRLYNTRTGKIEEVDSAKAAISNVVLPDQVKWSGGKPQPLGKSIRMSDSNGQFQDNLKWSDAHYVMLSPTQVFSAATNMVPFIQNDSAGRSSMSARHMAQAISVVGREAPMVQVELGSGHTFENLVGGGFLAHKAAESGVVESVKPDEIVIRGKSGVHSVHLYNHYPTNDPKGQLHSGALVKVGDRVKAGQSVADNNYTKNGTLALGTNVRAAYLSNGSNHEDGIVVSESAAARLASEHLYKPTMLVTDNYVIDKHSFIQAKSTKFTADHVGKIGSNGIIKVGAVVHPGDPLVLALREDTRLIATGQKAAQKVGKRLRSRFDDASMTWDSDHIGEVIRADRVGNQVVIHVKTLEPLQVGSKISTRHSAKGIVTQILADKDMPHDAKGKHVEMLLNPTCYDDKTEFLTKRGWVFGVELSEDDIFGTMSPKTFRIEWQRASRIVKERYRGKMYRLKNQQVDLLVTPNHRMFTAPRVKGTEGTLGALDFDLVDHRHFTDATAEEIFGQPRRYLKAGRWKGHDPKEFVIPQGTKVASGRGPDPKEGWSVPSHLWAEFMGWFLSEGHTHLTENCGYIVGISQTYANPEKREQIRELLESMGFEPTETVNGYHVCHKGLYELLTPLGGANEKYIPREILDLPSMHLGLFLDAYIAGDGNTRWDPDQGRYGTRRVSSNSKRMIDGLQEICIKLGYAANIGEDFRAEKYRTGHHYTMSLGPRCKAPWVNWDVKTKSNQSEEWVDYDGVVYCCEVPNTMIVVRRNGVHVVSGNSVPGRMNPGQILETAAGRIAEKTGKPYVVKNFQGGVDYLKKIQGELKAHGLKETDALYDPKTGRRLGEVTTGPHYVFQLEHQIDKKTHVRSGGPSLSGMPKLHYDANTQIPRSGGHHAAQSLGSLGTYAALASGLKDNLREMQTLKSDQSQAHEVWGALTNGSMLPNPQIPFVYKKFEAMLRATGINVQNDGTHVRLMPMNDAEVLKLSRGEIKRPTRTLRGKDDRPEPGGLFDPTITGGSEGGAHWGHIRLHEPMPNPIHAKSIARVLGIQETDIPLIIEGKMKLPGDLYGGRGIRTALSRIDVNKELAKTRAELKDPKLRETALEKTHFKYHSLRTLKEAGMTPDEAWTMQNVPVIPPVFRPQTTKPDGTINNNPLNALYRRLGVTNDSLKRGERIPYNLTLDTQAGLYQELSNLFGTTPKGKKALDLDMRGTREDKNKTLPGILHMIGGDQPKDGFFQDKVIAKKQDYTARATIVVDPNLSVDQLGVPKKIAIELYRPMITNRLIRAGIPGDKAQLLISQKAPVAIRALEQEIIHRPLIMKRDPVLHQYGLVGQNVRLTDDPAIKMSPLILPPMGADIDGDTVVLMVPLTHGAVEETKRILPSQRILSDSSGDVLYAPSNESSLALYRMTIPRGAAKGKAFKTKDDAERAFKDNLVHLNEVIHIQGSGDTTLGRARISAVVPEKFKAQILSDLKTPFDRKMQNAVLHDTAKTSPKHFVELADNLSRLGFQMAYESGHTVSLRDLEPLRAERAKIVASAEKDVKRLDATGKSHETTERWLEATRDLHTAYGKHFDKHPTNISDMAVSGIKAKREQFQGLIMAPMLVEDHLGRPSKVPITKSFAEGIDVGGYFLQAAGARRGLIQKTDSVREPGYMSKLLVQANIDQSITGSDCGTPHGLAISTKDKDVVDRHLASPLKLGNHVIPAGSVVTPDILAQTEKARIDHIVVRSPLKCRMPHGVCSTCMGVHPSGGEYTHGENVGIIAAQTLGERAAQLMLKQTHGGGIVSTRRQTLDEFEDVQRLFDAAKRSREDASLAPVAGKVTRVDATRQGSWDIYVEGKKKPLSSRQEPLSHIKPGYVVARGEALTRGDPNIHDLLATKGLEAVQSHMVDKIGEIYGREGVLRRHTELAVRSATGVVRITDSGSHDSYVRGDYVAKPTIDEINRTVLKGKSPIEYKPMLVPTKTIPHRIQPDWMARLQGERITSSVLTAVQHGHRSNLRGRHPIPSLAVGVTVGKPLVE